MYDPQELRRHPLPRLLLLPILLLSLTACGVSFSSTFEGTELFKTISVQGDMRAGSTLTVTVGVTPAYPLPATLSCYYEDDDTLTEDQMKLDFHDRAILAGSTVLEPVPGATPGEEKERVDISFDFVVEKPGDYFIACLTPIAPDNGIGMSFEVTAP